MPVSDWLSFHPAVAKAIVWEGPQGSVENYLQWPDARRAALENEVKAYAAGTPTALDDPPANLLQVADDDFVYTRIDPDHAWKLYLSQLACGLWQEMNKKLGWSVTDYPATALATLFDSRQMFHWRVTATANEAGYVGANKEGYDLDFDASGAVIPAPPYQVLKFLHDAEILPKTILKGPVPQGLSLSPAVQRLDAIHGLVDWCRNLIHYADSFSAANFQKYWGYRSFSPVMNMLQGTVIGGSGANKKTYTAGCSGTSGLIRAVLRVINIPAEIRRPADHAQPWFPLEGIGLYHGDEPYMRRQRYFPTQVNEGTNNDRRWSRPFPVSELFLSAATYEALFGANVRAAVRLRNVSRRDYELDLKYLPYSLLQLYSDDLTASTTTVAKHFSGYYSVAELQAANLWQKLAEKLASIGGPSALIF
jgi:hypothetical protein